MIKGRSIAILGALLLLPLLACKQQTSVSGQFYQTGTVVAPQAPEALQAAFLVDGLTLTWEHAGRRITEFIVERNVDGAGWVELDPISSDITTIVDAEYDPSYPISYRMKARNMAGDSLESNEIGVPTGPSSLHAKPDLVSNNQVILEWVLPSLSSSRIEDGYEVQRRKVGSSTWATISMQVLRGTIRFSDTADPEIGDSYRVRAYKQTGPYLGRSMFTNEVTIEDIPVPVVSTPVRVQNNTHLIIHWTYPPARESEIVGFNVYMLCGTAQYYGPAITGVPAGSRRAGLNISTLPTGNCQFKVNGFTGEVESGDSNTVSISLP